MIFMKPKVEMFGVRSSMLFVCKFLLHSDKNAQECDATKAKWIRELLAHNYFHIEQKRKEERKGFTLITPASNLEPQTLLTFSSSMDNKPIIPPKEQVYLDGPMKRTYELDFAWKVFRQFIRAFRTLH